MTTAQDPRPASEHGARILVVDDQPANLDVLRQVLEPEGHQVLLAPNGEVALRSARRARPDLILLDVMMPGMNGYQVCERLKASPETAGIPVIFVTAFDDSESLVRGFEAGAVDYVTKPFRDQEVIMRARAHLEIRRLNRELEARYREAEAQNRRLEQEVALRRLLRSQLSEAMAESAREDGLEGLVAESPAMQRVMEQVRQLQRREVHAVITGAPGTGKELVARAVHHGSGHGGGPFVVLDGADLPRDVMESIQSRSMALSRLFGSGGGALAGDEEPSEGCVQRADGGTLFVDQVTAVPVPIQASLFRAVDSGRLRRVGESTDVPVSVRLLASCAGDPDAALAGGSMDPGLHRMLSGARVAVPPLSERRQDVPGLVRHFVRQLCRELEREPVPVSDEAITGLQARGFPGNVGELRDLVEGALLASGGLRIEPVHLSLEAPEPAPAS